MMVDLTPTQEAFVRDAIARGRLDRPEDAVAEALLLWEQQERERAELLASLDEADAEIERGEYIEIADEKALRAFVEDIHRRGVARLAAERGG